MLQEETVLFRIQRQGFLDALKNLASAPKKVM